MRAIDFACRLLVNISRDDLPPAARLVLLCVVAGMETGEDIAAFTGIVPRSCTAILRHLEGAQLLRCVGGEVYLTTPEGRERVRRLLAITPAPTRP